MKWNIVILVAVCGWGCASVDRRPASEATAVSLEMRLAETEPGAGLSEALVASTGEKVYLHSQTEISNADFQGAEVTPGMRGPALKLLLTEDGAKKFKKLTGENLDRRLAVIVDGVVITAAVIRQKIPGGVIVIEGHFTEPEMERIAAGLVEQRTQ